MTDSVDVQMTEDEPIDKRDDIVEEPIEDVDLEDIDDSEDDIEDEDDTTDEVDDLGDDYDDVDALNRGDFKPAYFNRVRDNSVEWYTGQTIVTATFSQRKWINKLKRLAEKHPDEVTIEKEYDDCILVHMPIGYVKISPPKKVSAEQRERMRLQAQKNIAEGKFGRKKKTEKTEE